MVRRAFDILGIEVTKDKKTIKKAYALLVKEYHPEEHPAEWQKIHEAYQTALAFAQTTEELPTEELSTEELGGEDERENESDEDYEESMEGKPPVEKGMPSKVEISSNDAYGDFFQEAQEQWIQKKTFHEQGIQKKLRELAGLRGGKAVKGWQQFFETDFLVSEGEETLMMLLHELRENEFPEKVVRLILQTMNTRVRIYAEMEDNARALMAVEIVKYCAGQLPILHQKAERKKKMIGIPAALIIGFFVLAMTGLREEQLAEGDVSKIAAEYLNEKYDGSTYSAANLETEKITIYNEYEDKMDSYAVRERESGDVIAYAVRDAEDQDSDVVCFDNIQESDIRAAFEEKMNTITGHAEGQLFWDSSIEDSMSGGLEDGFFQTKYEGDFDEFIRQETQRRSEAPGAATAFFMSDYHSMNGNCDYYIPDPVIETMNERLEMQDYPEDTELQAALKQCADEYQIQIRGVVVPKTLFQEKMEQAADRKNGIYVMKDVHGTLGMEPSMSFLLLTGWYVCLPPEDEKLMNIPSGMYMQPVISMGEGIYGTESSIKGQGFTTDPEWIVGSIQRTENPESLDLTEAEKQKAVSFQLADGYVLKNDYCLAIDKDLYGIAEEGYRVMLTKQKGVSMDVADKHLEVKDDTAIEKYVSGYGDAGATLRLMDALDGEGYLFLEYEAAENAQEADIITIINP